MTGSDKIAAGGLIALGFLMLILYLLGFIPHH